MSSPRLTILDLPAEIRLAILEHVFEPDPSNPTLHPDPTDGTLTINPTYRASTSLRPLLVCRRFHQDAHLLAFTRTPFLITNLFLSVPARLSTLHPSQLTALRSVVLVADARHFRKLSTWTAPAAAATTSILPSLDALTVVLSRSGLHYLFDFTAEVVGALRRVQGVRRVVFVRNGARVKGAFRTWFNRLVGLLLKVDHAERYDRAPPCLGASAWRWAYDERGQSFAFDAVPVRPWDAEEEVYLRVVQPLLEELRSSVENEEWNPDPRARMMYY